jgi:hypothetical protein
VLPKSATTFWRIKKIWCQRRDSNSQTPVSKTGRYSNSRTLALWCTGEDLNLRCPTQGNPGYGRAVSAGLTHLRRKSTAQDCACGLTLRSRPHIGSIWRKVRRIERPWLITMPRFSGPVADPSAVPSAFGGECGSRATPARKKRACRGPRSNPLAPCGNPCVADKRLTVRPTLHQSKIVKELADKVW